MNTDEKLQKYAVTLVEEHGETIVQGAFDLARGVKYIATSGREFFENIRGLGIIDMAERCARGVNDAEANEYAKMRVLMIAQTAGVKGYTYEGADLTGKKNIPLTNQEVE